MQDNRPNPDTLLARVQEEETQRTRGKRTIFFGATAGVGKTYARLEAAHAWKRMAGRCGPKTGPVAARWSASRCR
jgi:two-component system sensor histidine kinase KdpD